MIVDMNILVPFSLGKVLFCAISKGIPCDEQIASKKWPYMQVKMAIYSHWVSGL